MHEKIVQFTSGVGGSFFEEAVDLTRAGGGLTKTASANLHPEVQAYIKSLRPDSRYQYVLMAPMGSYDYWGMNVNGDIFPEVSLAFDRTKDDPQPVIDDLVRRWLKPFGKSLPVGVYSGFGYRSFLEALRYMNHVNKDPLIAFGHISLSVWNPAMHRVEVVAVHDREKAKRVGAGQVIADIDAGKPRQISMGCRVPFDVCTVCGHIARTPAEYCEHLRTSMGRIVDGKAVGAVNFFPKFHDLSDVIVPAAKESGVLMKIASAKHAEALKVAELDKEVPSDQSPPTARRWADEPDLPSGVLKGRAPLDGLLTALAALGIVLKPHEFQTAALSRMGPDLADLASRMDQAGHVVESLPLPDGDGSALRDLSMLSPDVLGALAPLAPQRSCFAPYLPQRMMRITIMVAPRPRTVLPLSTFGDGGPLHKVAAAYADYRASLVRLPEVLQQAAPRSADVYRARFDDAAEFSKLASGGESLTTQYIKTAFGDYPIHLRAINPIAASLIG